MTAKTYEIGTLWQMADIPADAVARFLIELPDILDSIRCAKVIGAEGARSTWTDDGDPTGSVSFVAVE